MDEVKIKQNRNLLIVGIICLVALVGIVGYTYSFFQVKDTDTGSIVGTVASTSLEIEVEKLVPSTNVGLVPQLDEYITSAVVGRNNKNCVDDNGNEVCQVYAITVKNTSSVSVNVDGLVELNAGNNPNLKWAEIAGYTLNMTTKPTLVSAYNLHTFKKLTTNEEYTQGQEKTYYIVVWISETGDAQEDTGTFTGTVTFKLHQQATASDFIVALATEDACAANQSGICPTNPYTTETGETVYHEYRYRGAEVNNYVSFSNDLYRIIGVFDNNSHGIEDSEGNGVYMLKLIAANPLMSTTYGAYNSLDSSNTDTYLKEYAGYTNDFRITSTTHSNANILLNEYFNYNADTTYGACGNWTYYYNTTNYRTYDCSDILGYAIKDSNLKNYIETVKWYLYGYTGVVEDKEFFYTCERGGNDCTGPNGLTENVYAEDEIGLMYVSDYLYASGYVASDNTSTLADSKYNGNQNWLYKGYEWTITPRSNNATSSFFVHYRSSVSFINAYSGYGLRPTFYLKSSVLITGGDGTFDNPYKIST